MPGVERLSIDLLVEAAKAAAALGIPAIALFPRIDPAKKTATAYKAIAGDMDKTLPKGLRDCGEGSDKTVCVDRLKAYADYATAAMTLGAKPDNVWQYEAE